MIVGLAMQKLILKSFIFLTVWPSHLTTAHALLQLNGWANALLVFFKIIFKFYPVLVHVNNIQMIFSHLLDSLENYNDF